MRKITYFGSDEAVLPGDVVEVRVFFRKTKGFVIYVPGLSKENKFFDDDEIGVRHVNGVVTGFSISEFDKLYNQVWLLSRNSNQSEAGIGIVEASDESEVVDDVSDENYPVNMKMGLSSDWVLRKFRVSRFMIVFLIFGFLISLFFLRKSFDGNLINFTFTSLLIVTSLLGLSIVDAILTYVCLMPTQLEVFSGFRKRVIPRDQVLSVLGERGGPIFIVLSSKEKVSMPSVNDPYILLRDLRSWIMTNGDFDV